MSVDQSILTKHRSLFLCKKSIVSFWNLAWQLGMLWSLLLTIQKWTSEIWVLQKAKNKFNKTLKINLSSLRRRWIFLEKFQFGDFCTKLSGTSAPKQVGTHSLHLINQRNNVFVCCNFAQFAVVHSGNAVSLAGGQANLQKYLGWMGQIKSFEKFE